MSESPAANVSQQNANIPSHAGRDPVSHGDGLDLERAYGQHQASNDSTGDKITSCMSVAAPSAVSPAVARRVDQKDLITGADSRTNHGDTAKESTFKAAEGLGVPRAGMSQYKGSRNEMQPPFIPTANEETGG
jgi:hypothetical protein